MPGVLEMWTIYERPKDYPQGYIARKFEVAAGKVSHTNHVVLGESLEQVRALLPDGLYRMHRQPDDDACIVEVWL